jgi:hypothetical protein
MKLKVVIVDLEVSPRFKKWALRIAVPLGVLLGGGAIAWAAGLHAWNTGDTLQAADLNGNFSYLQGEIMAQGVPLNVFVKTGDNGTVDCDTFCTGAQWWGVVGTCVAASTELADGGTMYLPCSTASEMGQQKCWCAAP